MIVAKMLHVLAAIVWVGGMFFAYVCLRAAAGPLAPPERQQLWARTFERFFRWVWAAVVLLPLTGTWMIVHGLGGYGAAGFGVHAMQAIGGLMILIFLHLYFAPYRRFKAALAAGDTPAAGAALDKIRTIVGLNLVLGLGTAAIAAGARYWG
ncbi:MAG: hypothetical protein FJX61_10920 [Alphaproteobacteria bacterium]|nr:hypothetical protein [Alphaproteobacteria bacterium]